MRSSGPRWQSVDGFERRACAAGNRGRPPGSRNGTIIIADVGSAAHSALIGCDTTRADIGRSSRASALVPDYWPDPGDLDDARAAVFGGHEDATGHALPASVRHVSVAAVL